MQQNPPAQQPQQSVPNQQSAPLREDVARAARENQLGEPVQVHVKDDNNPYVGGFFVLAAWVLLLAAEGLIQLVGENLSPGRWAVVLPIFAFCFWMLALYLRRKGLYVFNGGFILRKGSSLRIVPWSDIAALTDRYANNGEHIQIVRTSGEKIQLNGMYTPGSAQFFPLLRKLAVENGWPKKPQKQ